MDKVLKYLFQLNWIAHCLIECFQMYSTGEKQKKYYLLFTKIKGARNFSNFDNFLKLQMKKIKNPVRLNSLIFY